jgi:hypothetical protein
VRKLFFMMILGLVVVGVAACSSLPEWRVNPIAPGASNQWVDIKVTPVLDRQYGIDVGYTGMVLEVRNKSRQDVTINWDDTYYLQAGQANGGFSLQGTLGARLKGYEIVLANETFVTTLYPSAYADPSGISTLSDPKLNWAHKAMPTGESGISIKLRAGSEEVREKLTFTISG